MRLSPAGRGVWSNAPHPTGSTNLSYGLHPDGKRIAIFLDDSASADSTLSPRFGYLETFFDEVRRR